MCSTVTGDLVPIEDAPELGCLTLSAFDRITPQHLTPCATPTLHKAVASDEKCHQKCRDSACAYGSYLFYDVATQTPGDGACSFTCKGTRYQTDGDVNSAVCKSMRVAMCGRVTPGMSGWFVGLIILFVLMMLGFTGLVVKVYRGHYDARRTHEPSSP